MKRIKITEEQAIILTNIGKRKKVQITLEQLEALSNADLRELVTPDPIKTIKAESLLGHPIGGAGKDEYKPQTEKENLKTFKEGVVTEGGIVFSLLEFAQEIITFLKDILSDPTSNGLSTIWVKLGVSRGELLSLMADIGLIGYVGNKIIVNRKNFKIKLKRLYNMVKDLGKPENDIPFDEPKNEDISLGNDIELTESDPWDNDPSAPWNQSDPDYMESTYKAETTNFELVYINSEIAIFKNKKGQLYFLYFESIPKDSLADYADREYTLEKDEDGDVTYNFSDFDINGDILENYINYEYENGSLHISDKFEDYENGEDYLFKINDEIRNNILETWGNDPKLIELLNPTMGESTMAGASGDGGASGPFVGPLNAEESIKRKIGESKIQTGTGVLKKKKDGTYQKISKTTAHYKGSDDKLRNCGVCKHFNENKCELVKGTVDKQFVCDGFEKLSNSNESTTSGSSGQYSTPKIWAKSKGDWRYGNKPVYPNGKMVENLRIKLTPEQYQLLKENNLSDGGIVKIDDCTKLNNNKVAQNGGCGEGDDGVVTVENIYAETARITGKSIDEVKRIIEYMG